MRYVLKKSPHILLIICVAGATLGVLLVLFLPKYHPVITEANYLSMVKPGIKIGDLKRTFGDPLDERDGPDGTTIFDYLAPAPTMQDLGKTNQFAGFIVEVKDGVVVNSQITTRTTYLQK